VITPYEPDRTYKASMTGLSSTLPRSTVKRKVRVSLGVDSCVQIDLDTRLCYQA
jgi:hypothetical protein